MKPNERAQQNHNELFPGHVSTLAVTDQELGAGLGIFRGLTNQGGLAILKPIKKEY